MKIALNIRRVLTVLTILDIGLVLAILGLPDIFGPGSLGLLSTLYAFAPLLILATLLSFTFGKIKAADKPKAPLVRKTAIILARSSLLATTFSIISDKIAAHISYFDPIHNRFVYENAATALLALAFLLILLLINAQNYVYWPLWGKSDRRNADERQRFVRQRVFEKSYRYIIAVLLVFAFLRQPNENHLNNILLASLGLMIMGLPSIIAAWQKDS